MSLVVIVVLTAFGWFALRANYEQNKTAAVRGVARTARLAGALGSSLVGIAQQEQIVLSKAPVFVDGDVAAIDRYFQTLNPPTIGFNSGLAWFDTSGVARSTSPPVGGTAPIDFASLDVTTAALAGTKGVEVSPGTGALRPIVFAVPTYGADFRVNGALVGAVLLDASSQTSLRSYFGTDALVVVDEQGNSVFGGARTTDVSGATARRALAAVGRRTDGVFADLEQSVVGFAKIPAAKWLVVVERPRNELFASDRWQFERSLFALGLLFVMSVLGAAYAAVRLDRTHGRETASRLLFQTVLAQLPMGVAAVDTDGRVVVTNERADHALGGGAVTGEPAPASLGLVFDAMSKRSVTNADVVVEPTGDGDDPASRTLALRAAPVEFRGEVSGAAVIVEDVTDARRLADRADRLAAATAGLAVAESRAEVAAVVAEGIAAFGAQNGIVVLRDSLDPDRLRLTSAGGFAENETDGWETIDLDSGTPVAEAARSGVPVFATLEDAPARFPEMAPLFEASGNQAWAALPLRSAGRVEGALGMSFRDLRDVDTAARSQLAGFAAQVSQALDRADRRSMEHDIALVLQQGILQPAGGDVPDMEIVSRYEPAEDHLEVGGDFFDVLPLSDGSVMLVIGDVVGHGIDAASAMGQLRSAARALSATTCSPARVLELLDEFALLVPPCAFATAAIVVVASDRRSLTYSLAGHPPPVRRAPDGTVELLDGALSRPLGIQSGSRPEASIELVGDGHTVCLYTDGLIERRGEVIDIGLDQLVEAMRRHGHLDCQALADAVLGEVAGAIPQRDDIALLCARF
ncbi:MAG: SpoIIE family protein phosphatase [Acidimicrobiales bacterium]